MIKLNIDRAKHEIPQMQEKKIKHVSNGIASCQVSCFLLKNTK